MLVGDVCNRRPSSQRPFYLHHISIQKLRNADKKWWLFPVVEMERWLYELEHPLWKSSVAYSTGRYSRRFNHN